MSIEEIEKLKREAEVKINDVVADLNQKIPDFMIVRKIKLRRECTHWTWKIKLNIR